MSSSDNMREVYRQYQLEQNKYAYFLLTAAGAAIAFATTQTQEAALAWRHIALAIGVIAWGASFFSGCRYLGYVRSTLYANMERLRVQSGLHPEVGSHPQLMSAASEGTLEAINSNNKKAEFWARWQFRLLGFGAVAYLAWHVTNMYLRANG